MDNEKLKNFYQGKDILVTGGVGSIGSEIVQELLSFSPRQVRILDNRETEIFHMGHLLKEHKNVRYLVGDVRDVERVRKAVSGCHIVFHAAALKHVPSCEYNPFEAVKTNVLGTQNVIDASMKEGVERVIFISTDKAVNPTNTMGATKLLAERLMLNAQISSPKTRFSCVRFGNVLDSQGSVVPLFKKQIADGGPLTITHAEMRRFFINIPAAVRLVLESCERMKGGEIFLLKMKAFMIKDLAEVLIQERAQEEVVIDLIGLRPGERVDEMLMTEEEAEIAIEDNGMFVIKSDIEAPHFVKKGEHGKGAKQQEYHSKFAPLLSQADIKKMLKDANIL